MKIYQNANEVYVPGKGWVKPETLDNWNDVTLINYDYIEITSVGTTSYGRDFSVRQGQEDVPIDYSRECLYADGCMIHQSTFFGPRQ